MYVIPSRTTLSQTLIPRLYDTARASLRERVEKAAATTDNLELKRCDSLRKCYSCARVCRRSQPATREKQQQPQDK
ncbi:hypothetical protein AAFF_G00297240 [Aldrovandia affinis]|uniref:Uncharacterized protein n=1 Tax=Aldrovandia affinis TaxID=143900 RepID=A0AAD7SQJ3_9TELE|nr:hypothetical protein AAFF_G00297240 [Aldrovandia affinis]